MDDIIVGFECGGVPAKLNLQAKRKIQISATNSDFADLRPAVTTRASRSFNAEYDAYGFAVEHVAENRFRTLRRLIDWAQASPTGEHFAARFAPGGLGPKQAPNPRCAMSFCLPSTLHRRRTNAVSTHGSLLSSLKVSQWAVR